MSDLTFHIHQFMPAAQGAELEHRTMLLKARDWAAVLRGRTISRRAFDLACEAHEVAGEFVFAAGETVDRLEFAAKLARHLVGAAMIAEQLEDGEVDCGD